MSCSVQKCNRFCCNAGCHAFRNRQRIDASAYNVTKLDSQSNLCEAFCRRQKVGVSLGSKRLFSTVSEQDFNQNVGEAAYSIYLAVC